MRSCLQALAGEIGIDAVLDNMADSLFNGQLPDMWKKLAPDTCKRLGPWMDHFEKRIQQYTLWVKLIYIPQRYKYIVTCLGYVTNK
jgi:dynein heavy chain